MKKGDKLFYLLIAIVFLIIAYLFLESASRDMQELQDTLEMFSVIG